MQPKIRNILKGKNKTDEQIDAINDIKNLYESREKVIKLLDGYFRIISKNIRINLELSPKQTVQRLPIALVQVKACNISEIFLNEIR